MTAGAKSVPRPVLKPETRNNFLDKPNQTTPTEIVNHSILTANIEIPLCSTSSSSCSPTRPSR